MRSLILLFSCLIAQTSLAQQPVSSADREVVFRDVTVIPMDRETLLEHQTVVTKNGKIVTLGTSGNVKVPKNATVVDGKGKYLIPGLAEMHAHVPPIDDLEPMKDVLKLFALNGITTIRGMLGHPRHLVLRDMANRGEILSPHFYTTGPSFNGMSVKSPEDGAAMVRKQKDAGYDFLKLHPGLTRIKFDSIAAAAHQVGIPFVGHVSWGVGVWRAIDANYSSIDHLDGFVEGLIPGIEATPEQEAGLFAMFVGDRADTTLIPRLVEGLRSHHVRVVPTQTLADRWFSPHFTPDDFRNDPDKKYLKPETSDQWINIKQELMNNPKYTVAGMDRYNRLRRKLIRECQKGGVEILLGSDAPQIFNVPGFSAHRELQSLVLAGLTPYQALRTGTVNIASYLNKTDAGVIREGAVSDLVLLNANPLADIKQTRNIAGVMIGNQWLPKEYITAELKKLERQ